MMQEGMYLESLIGEYNELLQQCAQKSKAALRRGESEIGCRCFMQVRRLE